MKYQILRNCGIITLFFFSNFIFSVGEDIDHLLEVQDQTKIDHLSTSIDVIDM